MSMRLKYDPASEPLHISEKKLVLDWSKIRKGPWWVRVLMSEVTL